MTETQTAMTTAELDAYVSECEQLARTEGWAGPWTLQVGDIQHLVDKLGRKLTADEGEYLRIPRWASAHVEWNQRVLSGCRTVMFTRKDVLNYRRHEA